jgi:hypothetical protein
MQENDMSDLLKLNIKENGVRTLNAMSDIVGAAAQATSQTGVLAANMVTIAAETAEMTAATMDELKYPVSKIVTDTAEAASHMTGIAKAPILTAEFAMNAALTPVNRLLHTFKLCVDRVFDKIDGYIITAAPQPA